MRHRCEQCFLEQHAILWAGVCRTINLLAVLNISMFFLSGEVKKHGYYYPIISLALLAIASLLALLPLGFHNWLGYYMLVLILCIIAGALLGLSILYWLHTGEGLNT